PGGGWPGSRYWAVSPFNADSEAQTQADLDDPPREIEASRGDGAGGYGIFPLALEGGEVGAKRRQEIAALRADLESQVLVGFVVGGGLEAEPEAAGAEEGGDHGEIGDTALPGLPKFQVGE